MVDEARLQKDLQDAMRARDRVRLDVLRGVITAVKNTKVEKQLSDVPEAEILAVLRRELNKRAEIADFARKAGRDETVAQAAAEQSIIEAYLPAQMDAAGLEAAIRAIAAELGSAQIGPVMAELRARHAGQFDGKLASQLIKQLQG